jgi:hypothetical protein
MSDQSTFDQLREAVASGLDRDTADLSTALGAFKDTPIQTFDLAQEAVAFLKELVTTETPSEPAEIKSLSKEEVVFATYRANFFEKIRIPALDDAQLEALYERTQTLWGEYPSEPTGRWVDWCLWTHLNRRRNGVAITEVIAGDKTAEDLKAAWIERHQAREERRQLKKIDDYDRYDSVGDVPPSIQQLVMSPFIEDEAMVDVAVEADEASPTATDHQES